ncbi:MAG: methionine synthase [Bryobacterales bacterium]|nr:methionine synthase [Bryobacterales bacterium]
MDQNERQHLLYEQLEKRILVIDGAMGTMLQERNLTAEDFGGAALEGCNENLVLTRPDVIEEIHRTYIEAGADIIETNTFGSTPLVLAEYDLEARHYDINVEAARIARRAADALSTTDRPRFVAGSMGPTTKAISVTGGVTFEELKRNYYQQAKGLWEGGADLLLLETCNDTRNVKAALLGIKQLKTELGLSKLPVMVSGTIEPTGTMLGGQNAESLWVSLADQDLLSIGLNCATGPEFMTDHLRTLHEHAHTCISCYPNAGLPDVEGNYLETPEKLAKALSRFADNGWLNIVGGCCGTTPAHIRAIAEMAAARHPRGRIAPNHRAVFSGIDTVEAEDGNRPLLVGERTNVIGSRAFKRLIAEEKWDEATDIARRQVRTGAHIIDVCLQSTDRDEIGDIPPFYDQLIRKIKAPVMIDTTDPAAIELALTYCQGKSIINSVNLEDGEEKFEMVCPLVKAYGAALVVGTIDEDPVQAQAFTRERKLAVAQRSFDLLTAKYGIPPENIIFDPLVFPCATGDENYVGGAVETIESLRLIKEAMPFSKTVLGVSNISFGLPPAAREVVNSVFLYHCTKAGLDLAIVNTEKLERFASIPELERKLAESLLYNTPPVPNEVPQEDPNRELMLHAAQDWRQQGLKERVAINQFRIAEITAHFREAKSRNEGRKLSELPLDDRLANYVIEGSKEGLIADLELKRAEGAKPLDIINGPLMAGMSEVGRLFGANELIVAEVLQSAEVMKAAVAHLEQFMEKADVAARAKILLATVKGDVHDIGKNLVEIIFANNGYEVINLGIKVPPEVLIQEFRRTKPDAIGLSGLLVKSAQQMVTTANDFRDAGIDAPLLVGGAALSEKFTNGRIAVAYKAPTFYCRDAMSGLAMLNRITDPISRDAVLAAAIVSEAPADLAAPLPVLVNRSTERSPKVSLDVAIPPVASFERHVRQLPNLQEVWGYINPYMLYGRHLGFKGNFEAMLAQRDPKALELFHFVEEVKAWAAGFLKVRAVWQVLEAERDGNNIHVFEAAAATPAWTWHFARQAKDDGLCLSDYILPPRDGRRDSMGIFVVTAGEGIRQHAEEAKNAGDYLKAHALQALAIETAEGAAEWLHRRIREDWGIPDAADLTMQQRFTSRYRGKRYSFGYPACQNLEDQQGIWALLRPEEIGVELTEGFMMDPEASVSALVFHHPDCAYFTASEEQLEPVAG